VSHSHKAKNVARNVVERKDWTATEDELIRVNVEQHGSKWRVIATQLSGRSDDAVRNRWKRLCEAQGPGLPRCMDITPVGKGTMGSNGLTRPVAPKAVRQPSRGSIVGINRPGRVGWSRKEDEIISSSVLELGNKWSLIGQRLPERTEHAIRNRYSRLQSILDSRGSY